MRRHLHVEPVMGTVVTFDVRGAADVHGVEVAVDAACKWLHHVDATYSTYRPDSVVTRLANGQLHAANLDAEIRMVLERCAELRRSTRGAFDVHADGRLDPSGYVKGWATQGAAEVLDRHGLRHYMVNAGGDIAVRGCADHAAGGGWRIGIRHPGDGAALAATAILYDQAIATSARYERGDHVRGRGAGQTFDSVTVAAADLGTADAWATAILAGGVATLRLAQQAGGIEAFVISSRTTSRTPGFPLAGETTEVTVAG